MRFSWLSDKEVDLLDRVPESEIIQTSQPL